MRFMNLKTKEGNPDNLQFRLQVAADNPGDGRAHWNLALAYHNAGREREALNAGDQALKRLSEEEKRPSRLIAAICKQMFAWSAKSKVQPRQILQMIALAVDCTQESSSAHAAMSLLNSLRFTTHIRLHDAIERSGVFNRLRLLESELHLEQTRAWKDSGIKNLDPLADLPLTETLPAPVVSALVFPAETRRRLDGLLAVARVGVDSPLWKPFAKNNGLTAVFHGPSGTGKTAAACELAIALGRTLRCVSADNIFGRYMGDSEANARKIFTDYREALQSAKDGNGRQPILFLDEAEGILGNRISASHSSDHTHNAVTAILLQELDNLPADGMLIAAMNNYAPHMVDPAFARRFSFEIEFEKPGPVERERIWAAKLDTVPVASDVDCSELARAYPLTGAEIELVCRNAAIDALAMNEEHLNKARIQNAAQLLSNSSLRGGGSKPIGF